MPPKKNKQTESEDEALHPFVEEHLDTFDELYETTLKIKQLQQELQETKRTKIELEQQICNAIMETLDEDSKNDVIEYKTLAIQFTTKPVLQIGKRTKKKETLL